MGDFFFSVSPSLFLFDPFFVFFVSLSKMPLIFVHCLHSFFFHSVVHAIVVFSPATGATRCTVPPSRHEHTRQSRLQEQVLRAQRA